VRLTRVYLPAAFAEGAVLPLEPGAALHLVRVLRLGVGARLAVFDGAGREHAASIAAVHGERCEVRVGAALPAVAESPLAITLGQGLSRGERMDYAIQKATELGVRRIVPLFCERSVVRLDAAQAARRLLHWRGVAAAACEQCGRATLPEILAPRPLADHLGAAASGVRGAELRAVLLPDAACGVDSLPKPLAAIEILIGPEGGLTDDEQRRALAHGYVGLRLGPRILRTETAAAAAIAALQAVRGDLG
jgi:16S rRNA (uracil1498-N3)-methyltransferase